MNTKPIGYEPTHVYDVDTEPPSLNSVRYKRYSRFSPTEWLLELLTSILSLILLAVIALSRPGTSPSLSAWDIPVSLNAVISILTTACSAALMHGVSEFISQLKWLHFKDGPEKLKDFETFDEASRGPWGSLKFLFKGGFNLATLGALITLCRLGFAPLAQQVVKIDQQFVITPDDNATFGYTHTYNRGIGRMLANSGVESIPQDPKMQSAVVQGLYGISSPATFSCPGACSWKGPYVSLGFKSECKNVTQETLRSANCIKDPKNSALVSCNMTTPGGLGISTRNMLTEYATNYWMNASSTLEETQVKLPSNFSKIAKFALYRATSDHNFNSFDVNITDCSLSLAAYEYSEAHANVKIDGNIFTGRFYTNGSKADGIPAFEISWADLKALQTFLESETIVTEWVDGFWDNANLGLSAALTGDVDIEERFQKMAASMTDYLRSGQNGQFARGSRMESEPYVSIRWHYLIGPAVIEGAALLFALFTIILNRRSRNVPLWKSSALAVLACQHDQQSDSLQTEIKDIKEIEKIAEKAQVQLK
ncbi:hypothetical protein B0T10DRAFT_588399 [Thelonectria olida]|uniref:Uncharacterized protein n=1 Tax=Thelonectria olida TaxID=1576542 RepID=A0A9P8VTY9_9HYPO|nr:hypothetical protein B0T10DRAFT_588399 [Thelonectria olida]